MRRREISLHRGLTTADGRKRAAVCKPRKASGETDPDGIMTFDFCPPELREENFFSLRRPFCVILALEN